MAKSMQKHKVQHAMYVQTGLQTLFSPLCGIRKVEITMSGSKSYKYTAAFVLKFDMEHAAFLRIDQTLWTS